MTLDEFRGSLTDSAPPDGCPAAAVALWHDAKGDWDAAHQVAQDIDDADGAWVHAYLHRKEGDDGNAAYWYRRAGQPIARDTLDEDLREALDGLPEAFREAVWLRDVEELSYGEIATALAIPPGTVMSRISRGRRQLHEALMARRAAKEQALRQSSGQATKA